MLGDDRRPNIAGIDIETERTPDGQGLPETMRRLRNETLRDREIGEASGRGVVRGKDRRVGERRVKERRRGREGGRSRA